MAVTNREIQSIEYIDSPRYGYWEAMYRAFFSRKLYVEVGKYWPGLGLKYLFLSIMIASIPLSIKITYAAVQFYQHELVDILQAIPKLTIKNGQVVVDVAMPYMIKNRDGEIALIVDTTCKIKHMEKKYPKLFVLITKDQFIYRLLQPNPDSSKTIAFKTTSYTHDFANNKNESLTGADIAHLSVVYMTKWMLMIMIYPSVVMQYTAVYLVIYLFWAFIAQMVAKIGLRFPLTYRQTVRLLIVSGTSQMVLMFLFLTLNLHLKYFSIIFLGLVAIYFNFAVLALKSAANKSVLRLKERVT